MPRILNMIGRRMTIPIVVSFLGGWASRGAQRALRLAVHPDLPVERRCVQSREGLGAYLLSRGGFVDAVLLLLLVLALATVLLLGRLLAVLSRVDKDLISIDSDLASTSVVALPAGKASPANGKKKQKSTVNVRPRRWANFIRRIPAMLRYAVVAALLVLQIWNLSFNLGYRWEVPSLPAMLGTGVNALEGIFGRENSPQVPAENFTWLSLWWD